jgi:hypothetical protein
MVANRPVDAVEHSISVVFRRLISFPPKCGRGSINPWPPRLLGSRSLANARDLVLSWIGRNGVDPSGGPLLSRTLAELGWPVHLMVPRANPEGPFTLRRRHLI